MIAVALLVMIASLWLLWEWKTGALAPPGSSAGHRVSSSSRQAGMRLPTSAALNADAVVVARTTPPA